MSFAGLRQFSHNLKVVQNSEIWRNADDAEKLEICFVLLKSDYDIGKTGDLEKDIENDRKTP